MGMFEDIEAELGIDSSDPRLKLASELVKQDRDLIEALVSLRIRKDLSQSDVAEVLGRHKSAVSNFERLGADPHLSTIRRYAAAINARIMHVVEDVEDSSIQHVADHGWVSVWTDKFELDAPQPMSPNKEYSVGHISTVVSGVEIVESVEPPRPGRHRRHKESGGFLMQTSENVPHFTK